LVLFARSVVVRSLRIESIIWRTTASAGLGFSFVAAAGFSFAAVAGGGRKNPIKQSAINHIPIATSIAKYAGCGVGGGAIRNRGLLRWVIDVWIEAKSGRMRARLQSTFFEGRFAIRWVVLDVIEYFKLSARGMLS
jgi:hypothetical protein